MYPANNSSVTLHAQPAYLSSQLIQTDIWTNLLQKFHIKESESIWITELTNSNDYQLALRCEDGLRIFQYTSKQNTWEEMMYSKDFCDKNGFKKSCYPIEFWKIPQLSKEILIS